MIRLREITFLLLVYLAGVGAIDRCAVYSEWTNEINSDGEEGFVSSYDGHVRITKV